MAVTEDVARLRLEMVGAQSADELRAKMKGLEAEMADLVASFRAGTIAEDEFDKQARTMMASHGEMQRTLKDASGGMAGFGQASVQAGRFLQDFQAAGVMGVANNLEQLAMALGGGAGLAGGLTLAATAYLAFKPQIDSFFRSFAGGNPIPEHTNNIARLKDQLDKAKDSLKEMEKQGTLTDAQLVKFKDLRAEVARLETEIADQTERQARIKKAEEAPTKEQAERAQGNVAAVSGLGSRPREALQQALARQSDYEIARDKARMDDELQRGLLAGENPEEQEIHGDRLQKAHEAYAKRLKTGLDSLAEKLFDRFLQGEKSATDQVLNLVGTGEYGVLDMGGFAQRVRAESPEGKEAAKQAKKAEEDRQRLNDQLREQGALNEQATKEEEQKRQEDARKKTEAENERMVAADERENERRLKKRHAGEKKGTEAEARRIEDTLGKQRQLQYEGLMAENAAAFQAGAPGAVAPQVMARRLQAQLAGEFRQRGAAPESAALAAKNIAGAGQQDLTRRQSLLAGRTQDTQSQTLMLTRDLMMEYQKLDGTQQALHQEVQAQRREMQAQRARSKSQLRRVGR